MITLKMKNHDNDQYELLAEMLPVIVTILGLIVVLLLYFMYD